MTENTYIKQLDDLRYQLDSLWESVSDGNISANAILEELNGMHSDLAFFISEFLDLDIDNLIQMGAE